MCHLALMEISEVEYPLKLILVVHQCSKGSILFIFLMDTCALLASA